MTAESKKTLLVVGKNLKAYADYLRGEFQDVARVDWESSPLEVNARIEQGGVVALVAVCCNEQGGDPDGLVKDAKVPYGRVIWTLDCHQRIENNGTSGSAGVVYLHEENDGDDDTAIPEQYAALEENLRRALTCDHS